MTNKKRLITFYNFAKQICIDNGYGHEIQYVENRHFGDIGTEEFFREYAFVVLSSGISNKAAESMYKKLFNDYKISAVKHPGKRKALERADREYLHWFELLQKCKDDNERIRFIQTLPYMGPATSYHLARNLGIDCAKPDRHLVKIAEHFGYNYNRIVKGKKIKRMLKPQLTAEIIAGHSPTEAINSVLKNHSIDPNMQYFVQWMCEDISKETGDRIGTVDIVLWRISTIRPPWKQKEGKVVGW